MSVYLFVTPHDTLSPRGHRQFGDAGSYGAATMPPAPSVFAGALRSSRLAGDPARLAACERKEAGADALDFRLTHASLARRIDGRIEALYPLPADLVVLDDGPRRLQPQPHPKGLHLPDGLPLIPVLQAAQGKPKAGLWLTEAGWREYLAGKLPAANQLVAAGDLWKSDVRTGLALDTGSRTGADGALFAVEHVAPAEGIGFLVGAEGQDATFAQTGDLRLAGDGRAARWRRIEWTPPALPLAAIEENRRFRLILATPGLFARGWLPPGIDPLTRRIARTDFSARLACAALPRAELVSGWNLLANQPKPALRAAPAGSVWWFDEFEGDAGKLAAWAAGGLWEDNDTIDASRSAEGWNRAWLGAWN